MSSSYPRRDVFVQAANALRWAVREMEERYKSLAALGVRNIEQFNRNVRAMLAEKPDAKGADGHDLKTLRAAVSGRGSSPLKLLAVTVLTNLSADDLRPWLNDSSEAASTADQSELPVGLSLQEMERRMIEATLRRHDGHRAY